ILSGASSAPHPGSPGNACFSCNAAATTEIYTLSLHDALPISLVDAQLPGQLRCPVHRAGHVLHHVEGGAQHGFVRAQRYRLGNRSEEHTSELQSRENLVCRLLLEKKKNTRSNNISARMHEGVC